MATIVPATPDPESTVNTPKGGEALRDGRYRVMGVLGVGAQGETLVAWDREQACEVAIKRFRVRGAARWKDVELAEREARVLATLEHPNLPRYFEHFEEEGCLYLVMERVRGESLATLCARGETLRIEDAWRLLAESAEVLDYLHGRTPPVVHRDIKPANVIRRPDGSFAFVDFGSVQHGLRPQGGSTVAGTFGYMAPEQLYGRAVPATDVYAVGATVLVALSGLEPERLVRRGLVPDVRAGLGRGADRRLIRLLQATLEPDPERRPGNLRVLLGSATRQARLLHPRQRRAPWLRVALAGAGAVLGTAAIVGSGLVPQARAPVSSDPTLAVREHWIRADFAGASGTLGDLEADGSSLVSPSAIGAHLLSGDFSRAAAASRRLAAGKGPSRALDLGCLADALEARQGDGTARSRLEAAARSNACRLLLGDLIPDRERLRVLTTLAQGWDGWPSDPQESDAYAAALLAFEVDPAREPRPHEFHPIGVLLEPSEILAPHPFGLEFSLPVANPEALLDRAVFESYLGNHRAAAGALQDALERAGVGGSRAKREVPEPGDLFRYREAGSKAERLARRRFFFLGAVLAVRAGETANARRYLELAPEESHGASRLMPYILARETGKVTWMRRTVDTDPWWPSQQLWGRVAENRPQRVVELLEAQRSTGLGVLPFAPPGMVRVPELQRWAETSLPPPCWGCTPQRLLKDLAAHRRIAQAVGAETLEQGLAGQVEHLRAALLRRDLAIPLYVLDRHAGSEE